jgi:hypothetical protein
MPIRFIGRRIDHLLEYFLKLSLVALVSCEISRIRQSNSVDHVAMWGGTPNQPDRIPLFYRVRHMNDGMIRRPMTARSFCLRQSATQGDADVETADWVALETLTLRPVALVVPQT